MNSENVDFTTLRFELLPQFDDDGMMNATDAWMIHVVLNDALRTTNEVGYREAIRLMSAGHQHYPLWARVKKKNRSSKIIRRILLKIYDSSTVRQISSAFKRQNRVAIH
jgi:hypothetical protein